MPIKMIFISKIDLKATKAWNIYFHMWHSTSKSLWSTGLAAFWTNISIRRTCSYQRTAEGCGNRNIYPAWILSTFPSNMDFLHPPNIPILVASCLIIVVDLRKSGEEEREKKLSELLKTWLRQQIVVDGTIPPRSNTVVSRLD